MHDQPRRSLRINWILARAGLAGGIRTIVQLAEAMAERGHESRLVYTPSLPWPPPWRVRRFSARLRQEWELRGRQRTHLPTHSDALKILPVRSEVIEPQDVPDADVTIGTWWPTMEWLREWPASKGLHAYYVQHHETHTGPQDRIRGTYLQPSLKLVVASWLQRVMAQEYGDPNAVLIPNAVDWEQFDSRPRPKPAVPTVGLLYSRRDWKDMTTAFNALRIVRETIPDLRVVAFGERSFKPEELGPLPFTFHLRPPQQRIPQIYRQCSTWLLTSITEGFGLCGLEAAASHCPVISTRCGGPEEYVRDGETGYLVDVRDSEALAERLIEILTLPPDDWAKMSSAAYAVAQTFNWNRSAEILEGALLEQLESSAR